MMYKNKRRIVKESIKIYNELKPYFLIIITKFIKK